MPTCRDLAMSLALGWAVSNGINAAWCADTLVFPAAQPVAATEKAIDLEVIRERYPDRTVKIERHVTQDATLSYVNHGPWTMWDPSGNVLARGEYWQGKKHGEWKRFYLAGVERHPNDLPDKGAAGAEPAFGGPEYDGFKKPFTSSATWVDDRIVGTWSVVDAEGKTLFSIDLDRNLPQGKSVWFFASGNKRCEIDFKQGVVDGSWKEWDAAGNLNRDDHYIDGRREADAVSTFDSGEKSSEGTYLYARENVAINFDWWTGAVKVDMAGTDGKPIKQGKWNYWYEDGGKRCEAEYVDDKPVARHSWWYRNGQKECEGEFVDGKAQGTWVYWHENGQKAAQGDYFNGAKVGKWIRWSVEGKVLEAKDHPYADNGLQQVPTDRTAQPLQTLTVPSTASAPGSFTNQASMRTTTVPTGTGYPIGVQPAPVTTALQPAPTTTTALQPIPAGTQVMTPQSYPQHMQPGMSQAPKRGGGGLFRKR